MHFFDYAIIRYMPDPRRGEIINLGLAVFRPSGLDIRMVPAAVKSSLLDGASTLPDIQSVQESFLALAAMVAPEDRYALLASASRSVMLSEKATFGIERLDQYAGKVEDLFAMLVKPPVRRRPSTAKASRLYTSIRDTFRRMDLLGDTALDIDSHRVVPHYPLGDDTGMTADFLLKNGRFHLTQVVDFNVAHPSTKLKDTGLKLVGFMEGSKRLGDSVGYFVFDAPPEMESEVAPQLNLVQGYCHDMFNFRSEQDKLRYFGLMSRLAGREVDLVAH